MRMWTTIGAALLVPALWATEVRGHCQVPCGIYGDAARVGQLREHARTIDKAVKQIGQLAAKGDAQSRNQLARWVTTKEAHAEKIIRTVSDYFMAQKIKPAGRGSGRKVYLDKLARHHAVMVAAMKCKQSVSSSNVAVLAKAIEGIAHYWR